MNARPRMLRVATVLLVLMPLTATSFAQEHKRRGATPSSSPAVARVRLDGNVVDANTNAPVVNAIVSVGPRSAVADAAGRFYVLAPPGTEVTLTFSRTGYQTSSQTVQLTANSAETFELVPAPTTTIHTVSGVTYEVDPETVQFGYIVPFAEYKEATHLNLCNADLETFRPDRADIRRITTGVHLSDTRCCPGATISGVKVEMKSGETITAGFSDACVGYSVDLIALDHVTAQPVYIRFADITEVLIP
jgi:hypothetical protein